MKLLTRLEARLLRALLLCLLLVHPGSAVRVKTASVSTKTGTKTLRLFVDTLPIPSQLTGNTLTLGAYKVTHRLHRDLPTLQLYGFGTSQSTASVPGPTILANHGQTLTVTFNNNIPDKTPLLPVDYTIGAPKPKNQGVPISVHLHGGFVSSYSDGNPDAWFTKFGDTGPTYSSNVYTYPNIQAPATLWYHDHVLGMTRLNVVSGLAGLYYLTNSTLEAQLNLPSGEYDIPIVIMDRQIDLSTGGVIFPSIGVNPKTHPYWVPEYFGDYFVVNGKVAPYLCVYQRKYRFRIVEACNAKHLNLFTQIQEPGKAIGSKSLKFTIVATEAGFLGSPVTVSSILIAPGERREVILDFSKLAPGTSVYLMNDAKFPYIAGDDPVGSQTSVMKFFVNGPAGTDSSTVPASLVPITKLDPSSAVATRMITMEEVINSKTDQPEVLRLEGKKYRDAPSFKPKVGTTEVWEIINLTVDWHPFHVHLVTHQVWKRQPFNKAKYMSGSCDISKSYGHSKSCFTGPPESPFADEGGWKETTKCPSDYVTWIVLYFGLKDYTGALPFDPTQGPGYVYHCHIVDHEDNDMMRPLVLRN